MLLEVRVTYTDGKEDLFQNVEAFSWGPAGVQLVGSNGLIGFVGYRDLRSLRVPAMESGLTLPAGLALPPGMVAVQ